MSVTETTGLTPDPSLFVLERYPRTAKYDRKWAVENSIGTYSLWLLEGLTQGMDLRPGMRVLDLGCGRAAGSIFLAREFGVQVWAVDPRIPATDNWKRACEAGVGDPVFPVQAEARVLPFADGFFDAVVAVNALFFFGTDDFYLSRYLAKLLKPGGQFGIVNPGMKRELNGDIPQHLKDNWHPDFDAYHSVAWWCRHWEKTGLVEFEMADYFPEDDGWQIWLRHEKMIGVNGIASIDQGRNITFMRWVARKKG